MDKIVYNLDERLFKEQLKTDLNQILEKVLIPRHREVLQLKFGDELTIKQIAKILGVSHQRVLQIINQSITNIKNRITEDELTLLLEYYKYI